MSKNLFDLIKTLSKAEKRVFSENIKKTKRMNYYIKLVTVYSKHEAYSPELDQKIFKSESPKFISDCKAKCKNTLYDYLVTLEKNKGIKKQVEHKLKIALMLKNRKQYEDAKKILEKIDKLATKYELLEELVEIKTQKIIVSMLIATSKSKIDMDYMKALILDKRKAIKYLVDVHHARDDVRLALWTWHIKDGALSNELGNDKINSDQLKNLSIVLTECQRKYCEFMREKNFKAAWDELEHLILLVNQNNDIVIKADLLTFSYAGYLVAYVMLSIVLSKRVDIKLILNQFDSLQYYTVKQQWAIVYYKRMASCSYALSINKPRLAASEMQEMTIFQERHKYLVNDNTANVIYPLFTYFALGNWEECLAFVDTIELSESPPIVSSAVLNIKLICIYEQNDFYYFNSLINQLIARKRNNGVKISTYSDLNDWIFHTLYCLAKKSNNVKVHFKKILENFDQAHWMFRYMVHWVACQFPELTEDEDYLAFLAKHNYTHYDFKAYEKESEPVFSLDLVRNQPQTA